MNTLHKTIPFDASFTAQLDLQCNAMRAAGYRLVSSFSVVQAGVVSAILIFQK